MDLELLGLNDYESKAYEAVVHLGKAGASEISKLSGVPYGRIYDTLASLEQRGFVIVLPGKKKHFSPSDPQNLLDSLKKKSLEMEKMKTELTKLKQIYVQKEFEPVIIQTGKSNFVKIVKEMELGNKLDYSIKYLSDPRPEWIRKQREAIKKGKDLKTLTRYDKETEKNVKKFLKVNPNIRKIDNEGIAMTINENNVMISLIKSNTTMLIRDRAFCKMMIRMFRSIYDCSEDIKSRN